MVLYSQKIKYFEGKKMLKTTINNPYQTSYTIETNCKDLVSSLKLKHGKYAVPYSSDADYTIKAIKEDNQYKIISSDFNLSTDIPLRKIEDIMYETRKYDNHIFPIHGGAVEHNGGAYLIVASTTSGKTTLTSYLTTNGFGYITDDCILLDRDTFNIYPFTTPVHLRGGGYDVLKKLNCLPKKLTLLDDISIKRYVYTPNNLISKPLPLKKIFFITRCEDKNSLIPMSTNEKITELLKSPIQEFKLDSKYITFISRLASMPCQRLYYSNMNFVKEVIENG